MTESWHLDKRVPIALILAMTGHVAIAAWGAAVLFKDIEANRNGLSAVNGRVSSAYERIASIDSAANQRAVQLGRIEENLKGLRSDINRLLSAIERGMRP